MEWVNQHPDPGWGLLPLTHITKGVVAEDIIRSGRVEPSNCKVFDEPLAYFFYGRPAYRTDDEGAVKAEALCPYCFVFKPDLIDRAKSVHAFDTGAFVARMYSGIVSEEMNVNDFRLANARTPNQLISSVFGNLVAYFNGDIRAVAANPPQVHPHQFHAKAYMDLILSQGRNEPDDRLYTVEVVFGDPVPLSGSLLAVVLPHTLWSTDVKASWLESLAATSVSIIPYEFMPGRSAEHYHSLLERAVKNFYEKEQFL
jgi:hypothetical protein